MRWDYDDNFRSMFSIGVHRDILIVPHATNVTINPGGPPIITNKRPIFDWDETNQKYYPRKNGNQFVLDEVDWVIDNNDIVKEKFKYVYSLNSEQNLTFSSANAAMVQFTIRNKKEYVEELDEHDQPTGEWYWEQEIPNLCKQEFTKKDPNGNTRTVTGEVLSHACIKVYTYINGDSSSLLYLGMFTVEEDKIVDNGYNRQITAYDFMATFRDMDIFNWYSHLFTGINKLDNDFEDATSTTDEETIKPDNYDDDENWVRKKREKWTIGDALKDLIENLCAYDMIVYDKGEMTKGNTVSNPNDYGRDGYPEGNGYSGFGMPVKLDDDIFDKSKTRYIPSESGPNEFECYGYMDILELEFYKNPSIIKNGALSMGKFLEDIGLLAGRYPFIRTDQLEDNDYVDPETVTPTQENPYPSKYNNYERCILSFKPLPSSKDDTDMHNVPEMVFTNHEIVKGFQHEYQDVEDVMIFKIPLDDDTEIEYKRLSKDQQVADSKSLLQTFNMPNNMFASYLVTKSDDDEIKAMLTKYKVIREDLFGTETKNGNMSAGAKFQQGYLNMKYRTYTPFQLTTYADPVRECGDRILINFQDKVTGEVTTFYSYILERQIEGIQKMMDTYTSNGNVKNPIITNYQLGNKKLNNNQNGYRDTDFMTPYDLMEYMRNCGYRMLDEPNECSAIFIQSKGGNIDYVHAEDHDGSWDGEYPYEGDTDTHGLMYQDRETEEWKPVEASPPYDVFYEDEYDTTYYIYSTNGDWVEHDAYEIFNVSSYGYPYITFSDPDLAPGDTTNHLTINTRDVNVQIGDCILIYNRSGESYGYSYDIPKITGILDNFIVYKDGPYSVDYGHGYEYEYVRTAWFIAPGVWSDSSAADDPKHRVIFGNCLGDWDGDHGYVEHHPSDNIVKWYEVDPPDLKPGDTIDQITVNGELFQVEFGNYIDIVSDYGSIPDYEYVTTNLSDTIWTNQGNATYVYPGVWLDSLHDPASVSQCSIDGGEAIKYVALKWTDPGDIDTWEPYPCSWEGTVVIRKEDSAPLHRWDGTKIVETTQRNKYSTEPFKDETIKMGRIYYYGFFPYYTANTDDPDHPIRYYTFSKVLKVETSDKSIASVITSVVGSGTTITVYFNLIKPEVGQFTSIKLYGKKNKPPYCDNTDDIIEDLNISDTSKTLTELIANNTYYFCIVTVDTDDEKLSSNVENCEL